MFRSSYNELGSDGRLDECKHFSVVGHTDGYGDDDGVDIMLERLHQLYKDLTS